MEEFEIQIAAYGVLSRMTTVQYYCSWVEQRFSIITVQHCPLLYGNTKSRFTKAFMKLMLRARAYSEGYL